MVHSRCVCISADTRLAHSSYAFFCILLYASFTPLQGCLFFGCRAKILHWQRSLPTVYSRLCLARHFWTLIQIEIIYHSREIYNFDIILAQEISVKLYISLLTHTNIFLFLHILCRGHILLSNTRFEFCYAFFLIYAILNMYHNFRIYLYLIIFFL